jgi:hypothetical protein
LRSVAPDIIIIHVAVSAVRDDDIHIHNHLARR